MNFLEALIALLFGGGKKPQPKPPSPQAPAPPQPAPRPPAEPIVAAPETMARVPEVEQVEPLVVQDPAFIPPPPELRNIPADPNFKLKPLSRRQVAALFVPCEWDGVTPANCQIGPYRWRNPGPDDKPNDYRQIYLEGDWADQNIGKGFNIPELTARLPAYKSVRFHVAGQEQLKALWAAWKMAGLLDLVLTYDGAFNPRYQHFKAGETKRTLSNHSFGTAFDINAEWNGLGKTPAATGQKGTVRELVPLAQKYGFYWGGDFSSPDGMHFELREILPPAELAMRRKFPIDPLA